PVPFEERFRPGRTSELRGPAGKRLARLRAKQICSIEGTVDDHRRAAVGGERQEDALGIGIAEVVRELHEVEPLGPENVLEEVVPEAVRGGNTDITHASLRF